MWRQLNPAATQLTNARDTVVCVCFSLTFVCPFLLFIFSFPPVFSLCAHVANHNSNNATQHLITLPLSLDTSTAKRSVSYTVYNVRAVLLASISNYSSVFFFFVCVSTSLKTHAPQGNFFFLYLVFFLISLTCSAVCCVSSLFFFHPPFFFVVNHNAVFAVVFFKTDEATAPPDTHTHTHYYYYYKC